MFSKWLREKSIVIRKIKTESKQESPLLPPKRLMWKQKMLQSDWNSDGSSNSINPLARLGGRLANAGDVRHEFEPWVRKVSWRKAWQPTPAFLPEESDGQRSLEGYSRSRACKAMGPQRVRQDCGDSACTQARCIPCANILRKGQGPKL